MNLLDALLETLPEGDIERAVVGLRWTAVAVRQGGEKRCGLATTLAAPHEHGGDPDVPQAGGIADLPAHTVAGWVRSSKPTLNSLGVAAINALIPQSDKGWREGNAREILLHYGRGKRVVMVGRFPFAEEVGAEARELIVLEQDPGPDDLPAGEARAVLPDAEFVSVTGMTLVNGTLQELLGWCSPEAMVMVMGPSTPLSPVLFDYGVDILAGSVVTDVEAVLQTVGQGAGFRQVHRAGVRLVSMWKSRL